MQNLSLVKYDYDSINKEWKKVNPNPYSNVIFIFLGEIPNMKGHCYVQDINTGKGCILDTDNLVELSEDEI